MNRLGSSRRRRPNSSPAQRAQWLARFEQSGLSQQAFAQEHGINLFTFRKWVEGQRRPAQPVRPPAPPLREVSLGQVLGQPPWLAEVQRPDGLIVRLGAPALP